MSNLEKCPTADGKDAWLNAMALITAPSPRQHERSGLKDTIDLDDRYGPYDRLEKHMDACAACQAEMKERIEKVLDDERKIDGIYGVNKFKAVQVDRAQQYGSNKSFFRRWLRI